MDAGSFWAMGGHGAFVWGSYGVTALLLIAEIALLRNRSRRARASIAADISRMVNRTARGGHETTA